MNKFKKVLIANRGEIAIRVMRACKELGITTVAIYSEEDQDSLVRKRADEAYMVGKGRSPVEAYLGIDEIIALAKVKNVDAIHPGYGFLAENMEFAEKCEEAGIVYIGPTHEMMDALGDKIKAKKVASSVGVPTIAGKEECVTSEEEAFELARYCGYPVIIKAAAGGGGRGVRIVWDKKDLIKDYKSAKREAERAFGIGDVFIEKYLEQPKHIEVQIIGDNYGNIVHLYERDCSIQRRHQKVIEFTPAFCISEEKRQEICRDALKIARAVNYRNAGTVEFLLDKNNNHYFIEMNPRIQVEHTITEMTTGIDIVQTQILIAQGCALDCPEVNIKSQADIVPSGYAIQCRVTTEDPANNFAPDTGLIEVYRIDAGFGIRLDGGSGYSGAEIKPFYDSLLVKVISNARSFPDAINKAARTLKDMKIVGVKTNIDFLLNILKNEQFQAGICNTEFIRDNLELLNISPEAAGKKLDEEMPGDRETPKAVKAPMGTRERIEDLVARHKTIEKGGGDRGIENQHNRGKYTARERLEMFFDPDSFAEVDKFVTHRCTNFGMENIKVPGEGVVTGYGTINGRLVYAYAQDFTVIGGSLGEMHGKKICKIMDMALKMGAPCIGINDSGGARIQEGVDALSSYGSIFYRNTKSSGVIPQISVIMGPCAGGAVYSPAITDFIFMVKNTSKMFITGPDVIETVTGEKVSGEKLGGAMTHSMTSGVAHFAADNEIVCFEQIKALLSFLPSNNMEEAPLYESSDSPERQDGRLNEIIPDKANAAYDMKEVIKAIADSGDFFEIQPHFAGNMIIGFIRLNGRSVGVIANQPKVMAGTLDINSSDKAARFIRFCDAFNISILNLVDVPGFLPGTDQEFNGIIRHGAKMLYAYSEATAPKVTMIIRKAYGGAYIAMCSKELGADQVIAWPTAEIAVMGANGAANIIFRKEISASNDPEAKRAEVIELYEGQFMTPYVAAERGYVDMVIEPATSRTVLINTFEMLATKKEVGPARKHGNIPL